MTIPQIKRMAEAMRSKESDEVLVGDQKLMTVYYKELQQPGRSRIESQKFYLDGTQILHYNFKTDTFTKSIFALSHAQIEMADRLIKELKND